MPKLNDCGVFVGLTTVPLGSEKDFYEQQIEEGIFAQYKKNLEKNLAHFGTKTTGSERVFKRAFKDYFYVPKSYALLGNYDIATIALVDDTSFSSRVFHPYNHLIRKKISRGQEPDNFTYKTIVGAVSDFSGKNNDGHFLIDKAKQTFLQSKKEKIAPQSVFPFLGICSLKINNGLLIGTGNLTLELILKAIKNKVDGSIDYIGGDLDYLVIQSFSWNELTILFFSNSYKKITDQILQIREMNLGDLKTYDLEKYEAIERNCLLKAIKEQGKESETAEYAPLFANTLTSIGFDLDLLLTKGRVANYFKKWDTNDLNLYTKLYVQPGQLKAVVPKLKNLLSKNKKATDRIKLLIGGRGDYLYADENDFETFRRLLQTIALDKRLDLKKHIKKIYTIPEISFELEHVLDVASDVPKDYKDFPSYLNAYTFKIKEINNIRRDLKRCRVSKILRDKVVNIFITYNDCIQDPVLFGYFIELKPFLDRVIIDIQNYNESKEYFQITDVSKELDEMCEYFEKAHRNRFHQSYIMNEITDYNIEFNGGIQQIVSAFDGTYKSISNILGDDGSYQSFVYVTGYSGVDSNIYNVRLNYYHLFQPELFVANVTHEAANKLLDQRAYQELNDLYDNILADDQYPVAVSYFLVDILTFYLAYNRDIRLFFYWHWSTFLQTSLYYNKDGAINENLFLQFLLRMMLLVKFADQKSGNNYAKELLGKKAPSSSIQKMWNKYRPMMKRKLSDLMDDPVIKAWMERSTMVAELITIDDFCGLIEKNINHQNKIEKIYNRILLKQHEVKNERNFFRHYKDFDVRERLILGGRIEEMLEISEDVVSAFKNGVAYTPKPYSIIESSSFYFHSLIYGYLKLIMEINNGEIHVLNRDENGEPLPDKPGQEIYLDSTGGHYNCDYELRRKYFQYRYVLLKSLWGASARYKRNYIAPKKRTTQLNKVF